VEKGSLLAGYWLEKFRDAYNAPYATAETLITEKNIAFLIGEYERSQVFINTPWKAYVEGDSAAISASAKKGALLFFNTTAKGGADCSSCHRGDFFTDELFHNLAMPQMGRGKKDGEGNEDFGRFRVTGKHTNKYAFRTPSLINTEVTGLWTHAGAYTSLSAVIKHHLNSQQAIDNYDVNQLSQAGIQNLASMQTNTQKALDATNFKGLNLDFTDEQVNDLVAFIKSLTDPCVKDPQCLAPWILDNSDTDADPNGDQINYSLFL
jgi:cytochrome c peroxidase